MFLFSIAESELEEKGTGFEPTIKAVQELGISAQSGADIFLMRPQPFCPENTTPVSGNFTFK